MRYLVLSDIHANWEALEAAARAAAREGYDAVVCLGDLVGYGADPNRVIDWVRHHSVATVRGNHDKACVLDEGLEWFNPAARYSALWTRNDLTPENEEWLRQLPRGPLMVGDFQLAHGTPLDEDQYLVDSGDARDMINLPGPGLVFFGHTHLQGGFRVQGRSITEIPPVPAQSVCRVYPLSPQGLHLVNPGSVGQPRDGDPRSAWAIYDSGARTVVFHRTPYDFAAAQRRIRDAGLPEGLARRLSLGR